MMNGPRYRVASAGPSRTTRPSAEVTLLHATIEKLKQELAYSQAESRKVTDQLNCLILLVKKAWTGDKSSAVHVANIVGVAPPDLVEEEIYDGEGDTKIALTAKPKSQALNNWAILTIGLLNQEYRRLEAEVEERQRTHLLLRLDYLEEQMILHRDSRLRKQNPPRGPPPPRHNSPVELDDADPASQLFITQPRYALQQPAKISVDRPPSGVKSRRPSGKHLYRQPNQDDIGMTMGDIMLEPSKPQSKVWQEADRVIRSLYVRGRSEEIVEESKKRVTLSPTVEIIPTSDDDDPDKMNFVFDGLYQLGINEAPAKRNQEEEEVDEEDEDRMYIGYDDPGRYARFGLFDTDRIQSADARKQRPTSAKQQKVADSVRARPKSAVVKGERPLKYETTRPVSGTKARRAQSAKERLQSGYSMSNGSVGPSISQKTPITTNDIYDYKPQVQPHHSSRSTARSTARESAMVASGSVINPDLEEYELLRTRLQKPESVIEFEKDLEAMNKLENSFKNTAVSLQKQLGISPNGMVFRSGCN